jgi:serine/threonine-protein kinase
MASPSESWVGQELLDHRYAVLGELGHDGLAVVYRGRDHRGGGDVAIKVPQPALLQDADFARRFGREVQALIHVSHPHLVRVLDGGIHQGRPFAVLQYLPGGSLRSRYPPGDPRPALTDLRAWLPQLAAALDFLHRQGFVHRDVRPDNLLFDADGNAFVGDFCLVKTLIAGAAARPAALGGPGNVIGTGPYLAPELILGQAYDERADQFALAASVYEALSGHLPFDGATLTAIYEQQKQGAVRLDRRVPQVLPGAALAVQQALHFRADRRFSSCAAFAETLLGAPPGLAPAAPVAQPAPAAALAAIEPTVVEKTSVFCPKCRQKVGVRASLQGKRARCTHCQHAFVVPALVQLGETQQLALPRAGAGGLWAVLGCAALLLLLAAGGAAAYVYFEGWPDFGAGEPPAATTPTAGPPAKK